MQGTVGPAVRVPRGPAIGWASRGYGGPWDYSMCGLRLPAHGGSARPLLCILRHPTCWATGWKRESERDGGAGCHFLHGPKNLEPKDSYRVVKEETRWNDPQHRRKEIHNWAHRWPGAGNWDCSALNSLNQTESPGFKSQHCRNKWLNTPTISASGSLSDQKHPQLYP